MYRLLSPVPSPEQVARSVMRKIVAVLLIPAVPFGMYAMVKLVKQDNSWPMFMMFVGFAYFFLGTVFGMQIEDSKLEQKDEDDEQKRTNDSSD